jgi:hypothetical protein
MYEPGRVKRGVGEGKIKETVEGEEKALRRKRRKL